MLTWYFKFLTDMLLAMLVETGDNDYLDDDVILLDKDFDLNIFYERYCSYFYYPAEIYLFEMVKIIGVVYK